MLILGTLSFVENVIVLPRINHETMILGPNRRGSFSGPGLGSCPSRVLKLVSSTRSAVGPPHRQLPYSTTCTTCTQMRYRWYTYVYSIHDVLDMASQTFNTLFVAGRLAGIVSDTKLNDAGHFRDHLLCCMRSLMPLALGVGRSKWNSFNGRCVNLAA